MHTLTYLAVGAATVALAALAAGLRGLVAADCCDHPEAGPDR